MSDQRPVVFYHPEPAQSGKSILGNEANTYPEVQRKLHFIEDTALPWIRTVLEEIAKQTEDVWIRAEDAQRDMSYSYYDDEFVSGTGDVMRGLASARRSLTAPLDSVEAALTSVNRARSVHRELYEVLDQIRRNRRHRTPNPGALR